MNDTILNNEILLNIGRFMNLHEEEDFILCDYVTRYEPRIEPITDVDHITSNHELEDTEISELETLETTSIYSDMTETATTDTYMSTDQYDSDDDIHIQINKYKMSINDINADISFIETELYESIFKNSTILGSIFNYSPYQLCLIVNKKKINENIISLKHLKIKRVELENTIDDIYKILNKQY